MCSVQSAQSAVAKGPLRAITLYDNDKKQGVPNDEKESCLGCQTETREALRSSLFSCLGSAALRQDPDALQQVLAPAVLG